MWDRKQSHGLLGLPQLLYNCSGCLFWGILRNVFQARRKWSFCGGLSLGPSEDSSMLWASGSFCRIVDGISFILIVLDSDQAQAQYELAGMGNLVSKGRQNSKAPMHSNTHALIHSFFDSLGSLNHSATWSFGHLTTHLYRYCRSHLLLLHLSLSQLLTLHRTEESLEAHRRGDQDTAGS